LEEAAHTAKLSVEAKFWVRGRRVCRNRQQQQQQQHAVPVMFTRAGWARLGRRGGLTEIAGLDYGSHDDGNDNGRTGTGSATVAMTARYAWGQRVGRARTTHDLSVQVKVLRRHLMLGPSAVGDAGNKWAILAEREEGGGGRGGGVRR
jgi:hypothetical protein